MPLSGTQLTRIGVGGPTRAYFTFTAKPPGGSGAGGPHPSVGRLTRIAVGGPGVNYFQFSPKGPTVVGSTVITLGAKPHGWRPRRRPMSDQEARDLEWIIPRVIALFDDDE